MTYNCVPISMAKIKKKHLIIPRTDKDGQHMQLSHNLGGVAIPECNFSIF